MEALEIVFIILLNALPIVILVIPLFFIWKRTIGKLYLRIILGITIFYVIYWILPIIFQVGETPDELGVPVSEEGNIAYGIGYIFSHLGSLITQFFSYPIVTLPFIFLVAPFISIILFWNRLRKEEGTLKSNLEKISYEIKESPLEQTKKALIRNDWSREKQILKLMIVLLPISLYLMQVILQISGLTAETLTSGETALGWFLEILFVYLAIFIFSIEILFSSQVALKGRFFGEQIREQTYKSLYTIGTPMSVFSVILFAILYVDSISIIIYFFAYFIMASVIFILFIDIFEPISILIFVKVIDWWKNRKKQKVNTKNFYYMLIFGALALVSYFIINLVLTSFVYTPFFGVPGSLEEAAIYSAGEYATLDPNFALILQYDLLITYGIIITEIIPALILTLFLAYGLKFLKSKGLGISIYLPVIITLSILIILGSGNIYWLTGKTSFTRVFGFDFYTLRSASLDADLTDLLYILAAPYLYTRYIFNIILWSLVIFYFKKQLKVKNFTLDEEHIKKIIYSTVKDFPIYDDYAKNEDEYLISRREDIDQEYLDKEREEIRSIMQRIEDDILLEHLKPSDENEMKRFYFTLRYLYNNGLVNILKPEVSFIFEPVEKQGLYIIYDDGRGVYNYAFKRDAEQDPGLVSGMFSAITSFIKEMTRSTEALKKIDHGDITILLEYGNRIFGALFIKGNQTTEVRTPLKEFVKKFETQYNDVLKNWTGSLAMFKKELNDKLVEDTFKEE
ncbi:MAG: hypothetical protein ACFE9S_06850 [Candidatus Hermodarchaeota archaeon]